MKRLFLIGVVVLFTSCIKKPGVPDWYSTYQFPILHDTVKIEDLLDDTTHIIVGPDSLLTFFVSSDIDTIYPAESIRIENRDTTVRVGFGKLVVRDLTTRGITISWQDFPLPDSILDTINNHVNDSVRILLPTILPDTVTDTTDTLTKLDWASISYASVRIQFENNFPITISPYSVWIYSIGDFGDSTLIFHGEIDSISPYEHIDTTLEVSNVYTTNTLRLVEYMGVPGGDSVYVSSRNNFFIRVSVDSIVVDSARAYFPGFSIADTFGVTMNFEEGSIDTVVLDSGILSISLYNPLDIYESIEVSSENLITNGMPFDTTLRILPDSTTTMYMNLAGRKLIIGDSGISFAVNSTIDSQWLEIRGYDSVDVYVSIEDVALRYAAGTFDSVYREIPEIDTTLDLPDTLNFRLARVYLTGELSQTMNLAPLIKLYITNIGAEDTVTDTFEIQLNPGRHNNPVVTPINLDLSRIFSVVPQRVIIDGDAVIDGRGSIYRDDFITGSFTLNAPFRVIFRPDTMVSDTSVDSIQVDQDILDRFNRGSLYIRLRNRIPLGFGARLTMYSDAGDTLMRNFTIPAAPHDEAGFATGEKDTTLVFSLTHDEALIFGADQQTSWMEIYIPGTDTISVRISDYIKIDVFGEITVRMGE